MPRSASAKLKLPNMNEFSPGVLEIGIRPFLIRLAALEGDRKALVAEIATIPKIKKTPEDNRNNRNNRANNVLIGMSQCGLLDLKSNRLTELSREIIAAETDPEGARRFAKHILSNLHGARLLEIVDRLRHRQEQVTLEAIRRELRHDGFTVTTNEGNPAKLRLWLQEAGLIDENWNVDQVVLKHIAGVTSEGLVEIERLSAQQRVLLNKIRRHAIMEPLQEWIDLAPVKALIEIEHGPDFLHGGTLRQKVILPLKDAGWIETSEKQGRGGKIGQAKPTAKLLALKDDLAPPIELGVPPDLRDKLRTPVSDLFNQLESDHRQTKGAALELLALRLLLELGLTPTGFRLRAKEAEYAEADLNANGIHLHYSRWLVQCKNTPTVTQPHLMREVGLATVLKAHVVLLITTGDFGERVAPLADQVSRETHLQVLLIDKKALAAYRASGITAMIATMQGQAHRVLRLKAQQERLPGAASHGIAENLTQ